MPSYPTFDRNPLDLVDEAEAVGKDPAEHVVELVRGGELGFACEDPDAPENWPRVLTVWRSNLLGSSAKGTSTSCATSSAPTRTSAPERLRRTCARKP